MSELLSAKDDKDTNDEQRHPLTNIHCPTNGTNSDHAPPASSSPVPGKGGGRNNNKSVMAAVCRRWRLHGECAWLPDRCGFTHPPELAATVVASIRNAIPVAGVTSMVLTRSSSDAQWAALFQPVVIDPPSKMVSHTSNGNSNSNNSSSKSSNGSSNGVDKRLIDVRSLRKVIERKLFQSERAIHNMIDEDGYISGDDHIMDTQMKELRRIVDECKAELARPIDLPLKSVPSPSSKSKKGLTDEKENHPHNNGNKEGEGEGGEGGSDETKKRKRTIRIGRARKAYAFISWIVDTFTIDALQPLPLSPSPSLPSLPLPVSTPSSTSLNESSNGTCTTTNGNDVNGLNGGSSNENDGHDEVWPRVGVVDVAGGRGDVSYVLAAFYHIRSLIVDPRAPSFRKMSHSLRRAQSKHADQVAAVPSAVPPALPTISVSTLTDSKTTTTIARQGEGVSGSKGKFAFVPPQHVGLCFPVPFVLTNNSSIIPSTSSHDGDAIGIARGMSLSRYYQRYGDESNGVDNKTSSASVLAQARRHLHRALQSCTIVIGLVYTC
jgi:hypothetical protein